MRKLRAACVVAGRGERWLALGGERSFVDAVVHGDSDTGIVLVGQIDPGDEGEFTLGLAFGHSCHAAITTLLQSLAEPFDEQADRFKQQWKRAVTDRRGLERHAYDGGNLYRASYSLILGHEDKTFPGATVASLSVPWGEAVTADEDEGGYHLIWTRDMVQTGTALLAAGQKKTPLRMLTYLAAAQRADGSFIQCCWTDGTPYFNAVQLDEVAFPILLARRLHASEACDGFDPAYMVASAARYLLLHGPITQQERWEEAGGYSPSTLAAIIAASVCAAAFAAERGDFDAFDLLTDYADWLRAHVVDWTVTQFGSIVEKIPRHFVRLNPVKTGEPAEAGAVDHAILRLSSQPPGARSEYVARDIVDAGFLELVRHGIFAANDPLIVDSLRVVDHVLKRTTPLGDAWRRYTHDGYGQAAGGAPYTGHGVGRAWPLLTGERAHYELAAGGKVRPFVAAMERFAGVTGMLPEQVWDEPDLPEVRMYFGCPTGSAAPLIWAHAEYMKLLRSIDDGRPFDRFDEVAARYIDRQPSSACEFWTFSHPTPQIDAGRVLRLLTDRPFSLRYSCDGWATFQDQPSRAVYGVHVTDLLPADACRTVAFTFHWADDDQWAGRNFDVTVRRH